MVSEIQDDAVLEILRKDDQEPYWMHFVQSAYYT